MLLAHSNLPNLQKHVRLAPVSNAEPLCSSRLQVTLGLYIIRGDNIAIVGEVDEQVDGATDWSKTKAEPLKHIVH